MPGLDADVVVVGAGVIGAATARALAADGRNVRLLERFTVGHALGSSHGSSRIFRISYPDERYVRLAQAALTDWRKLEAEHGSELLRTTGSVDLGEANTTNARALSACGVAFELIDGRDASTRWPLTIGPREVALHQPDAGALLAAPAWQALVDGAVARGAVLEENTRVASVSDRGRTVVVETETGPITARCAVVAAGAWAAPLLATAGIELPVVPTRETVAHFEAPSEPVMPCVIDDAAVPAHTVVQAGALTYALASPGIGVKVGLHHSGPVTDPDVPGEADAAVAEHAADWIARRVAGACHEPTLVETCLYTNTADESFVLERHGRIVVASACSGHAFKFAPVLGRTVSALASDAVV